MDMDESSNEFAPEMTGNDLASDLASFVGTSLSSFPSSDYRRLDVLLPQLDDSDEFEDDKLFQQSFFTEK